ncbi:BspA family leucine-rich repeat surface protein, partial [Enterococcus termitis]|uniref:BspA family leucine-rich repeat surface protein n=1 Tax=Enterococcus termitis TaxID=332950 RepID=UPI003CCB920F
MNIQTQIEKNALLEGKPIKKIQFCEKVTAHYQSSALFRSLSQLDEIEGLNLLDTSNVKFLDAIFEHSSVQHLDLSSWDTSNVETMTYAFRSSSISELDLSSWNLSKTTLLTGMFDSSKVSKLNISNWDTSNVTGMNYLFANTTELDSVDLKGWDTSNVTELNYLFNKSGVSSIDLSNFHTPKLKNATYMFANTPHLEKINIANLDTSLAGFNGKAMFQGAHQLNELTLGANFHFVSDAELSEGAIGVPIALWNSPKGMIHESSSLLMKEYDGTDTGTYRRKNGRKTYGGTFGSSPWFWDKETQTVSFYGGTFQASYGNINIQTQIEKNALLEGKPIKKIQFCEKVTAHYQSSALFRSLSQLDEIEGLNLLDTSNVKFLDAIFEHSSVQHLDLSSWDTSNVETMTYAFRSSSISELDLSSWNLSKTTLLTGMFDSSKVSKLNISNWDTSNVTGMNYLFANTTELDSVDLKGWDTSNVTELNYLFNKSGVSSIDLSNFHTPKLKNATYMFANTPHLEKINIANLDTSLAGFNGKAMFQGAHQLNELTLGANFHFVSDAELSEGAIGVPIALWNSPKGMIHESSSLLMKEYDGTDTGTYRRKNGRKTYGGTFGSSPWFWDKETQTVSFYGGTFQASYGNINIQTQIEKNALLEGKPIKKIQFCEKVTAHYQSSALFRSLSQLEEIEGLNLLDTSNVKFLDAIFEHSSVQHLDLISWDTSNVE